VTFSKRNLLASPGKDFYLAKLGVLATTVTASLLFPFVARAATPDNVSYAERCETEVLPLLRLPSEPKVIKVTIGKPLGGARLPKSFNGMYCQFSYPDLNIFVAQHTRKLGNNLRLSKPLKSPCGEILRLGRRVSVFAKATCGSDLSVVQGMPTAQVMRA
jgi:hypothetical protein